VLLVVGVFWSVAVAVLGMVELLEVAELWLWSGLVDAAPALLVDGEFCAEVLEGLVRSTEDAEDALWSVLPAAGAADPGVVVLDELLWLDALLPTLLADVSFDVGGGVVVVDWLFVGLALLGEPGIELLGEVAAAPVAL